MPQGKKIRFKPIRKIDKELVNLYLGWFQKPATRRLLYKITPKTQEEMKVWIADCCQEKTKQYFLVSKQGKLAGHIGLKKINLKNKTAEIGSFFVRKQDNYNWVFLKSTLFIINYAKKLGLKLLAVDHSAPIINPKEKEALLKLGFVQDILAPHYFTLALM